MAIFGTKVTGIVTGAAANTFKTILGIKFASTTGHRGRLRRLVAAGAGGAAQDTPVSLRARRTDNIGDGTSTAVNINTIAKQDVGSVDSNVAVMGKNYTVEPTAYPTDMIPLGSLNSRGTLPLEWPPGEGPEWGPDETLGIEGAPGTNLAVNLDLDIEWEEF